MTARKALMTVLLWGVAFAVLGGAIGAAIGAVAPEYYRSVFRDGRSPEFNPLQTGIGLGTVQGLALGIVTALVVIAIFAWRDRQYEIPKTERGSVAWSPIVVGCITIAITLIFISAVAFILGAIFEDMRLYRSLADEKLQIVGKILEEDDFQNVQPWGGSDGHIYLSGEVKGEAGHRALRDKLVYAFGDVEAKRMIENVKIAPTPQPNLPH
jgi:MFS family permease